MFSHFCGIQLTTFVYVVLFYSFKIIRKHLVAMRQPSDEDYTLLPDTEKAQEKPKERQIDHVPVVVAGALSGLIWSSKLVGTECVSTLALLFTSTDNLISLFH